MCFSNATHYLFFELTVGCQPTLGHSQGVSLTNPMLIAAFIQYRSPGALKQNWVLYPSIIGENVQIYSPQITGKCICEPSPPLGMI